MAVIFFGSAYLLIGLSPYLEHRLLVAIDVIACLDAEAPAVSPSTLIPLGAVFLPVAWCFVSRWTGLALAVAIAIVTLGITTAMSYWGSNWRTSLPMRWHP